MLRADSPRKESDAGVRFLARRGVLRISEADGMDLDRIGHLIEDELEDVREEVKRAGRS